MVKMNINLTNPKWKFFKIFMKRLREPSDLSSWSSKAKLSISKILDAKWINELKFILDILVFRLWIAYWFCGKPESFSGSYHYFFKSFNKILVKLFLATWHLMFCVSFQTVTLIELIWYFRRFPVVSTIFKYEFFIRLPVAHVFLFIWTDYFRNNFFCSLCCNSRIQIVSTWFFSRFKFLTCCFSFQLGYTNSVTSLLHQVDVDVIRVEAFINHLLSSFELR